MTVPILQSSTPADAATDVSLTVSIVLTFNTSIDADSINPGTVTLYLTDSHEVVDTNISVSAATVTILPQDVLIKNTTYKVVLSGDATNPAGRVKSSDGDYMAADDVINFRTGEERYVSIEEITERTDIERYGPIRESDPLATTPATGTLEVSTMSPVAYAYDVAVTTTGVILTFNQTLDDTAFDVDEEVVVTQTNLFGMDNLYAEDTDVDGTPDFDPDTETNTAPTGTLSVVGSQIIWARQAAQEFLHNTQVLVSVGTGVKSTAGAALAAAYSSYFTTEVFPRYAGVGAIRISVGASIASLYDDTISRILHKNSIDIWEMSGRGFAVASPSHGHRQYVVCKTIIDIINVLTLAAQLSGNETKTLGDFSIQHKPMDPKFVYMLADAKECIEDWGKKIWGGVIAIATVKGLFSPVARGSYRYRSWDRFLLRKVPVVGTAADRKEIFELDLAYSLGDKAVTNRSRYI